MQCIPDYTTTASGVGHCIRLGMKRDEATRDFLVDLSLVFLVRPDGEERDLPDLLSHASEVLRQAQLGGGDAKVQHEPETVGRADLWVLEGDEPDADRSLLASGVSATVAKVVLHAEVKQPRVVYTVRLQVPQETAGLLVGTLQSRVELRFEPAQADLPMTPKSPRSPRAEA